MKAKLFCLLEVCGVFVLAVVLYRCAQSLLPAAEVSKAAGGRPVCGYLALLLLALILYLLQIWQQGLVPPFSNLKYQLKISGYGFLPVFVLSSLLSWIHWRQWPGAVLISIIEIGLLVWFALWVRGKTTDQSSNPAASLALVPLTLTFTSRPGDAVLSILYWYLLVAVSEELLSRGYTQTRLNAVFGRPWSFFGTPVGWGWIVTSIFFGLWHLGLGSGTLNGPHALWTVFAGLIFGLIREKSAGITAPVLLHGVLNYGPQAILFDLITT